MVLSILRPSALSMVQPKYSDAGRNVGFPSIGPDEADRQGSVSGNAVFQGLSEFSERLLVKTSTYLSYCYSAALGWDGGLVNLHTVAPEVSMYP